MAQRTSKISIQFRETKVSAAIQLSNHHQPSDRDSAAEGNYRGLTAFLRVTALWRDLPPSSLGCQNRAASDLLNIFGCNRRECRWHRAAGRSNDKRNKQCVCVKTRSTSSFARASRGFRSARPPLYLILLQAFAGSLGSISAGTSCADPARAAAAAAAAAGGACTE